MSVRHSLHTCVGFFAGLALVAACEPDSSVMDVGDKLASWAIEATRLCWKRHGLLLEPGVFYAASIIEPWTRETQDEVTLYWLLSTWNPYHVVLMRSSLARADVRM